SKPRPVKIRRAERKEGSPPPAPRIGLSEKTLRLGEAAALDWSCVEWGADVNDPQRGLVIRASGSRGGPIGIPKSGRRRRVGLSRRLRAHLRGLWMRAGQPSAGLVVPGLDAANYRHRRVCRAARIGEQWRPKDLRDSYASWLLTCGIQLGYVFPPARPC